MPVGKQHEPVVIVYDIHKEFNLPQNKNSTFKQTVVNIVKNNNKVTQKVLDGVSFNVNKGDFFGIVGRNGSGKSTLLKILAGVYTPTKGSVEIRGGLTPFIELGVGFNPELSGRDNVYLNGALLGYNRRQMDVMYDEIVEFAELGPFMDQKLKNYSSGMQVRLAFSIAIKAKNDVLIFDEVLAVGDEAFQRKCLDVFDQYRANKQTVILVTHSMDTVRQYCNQAILVDKGKIISSGNPNKVADVYSKLNQESIDRASEKKGRAIESSLPLQVRMTDSEGKKARSFGVGDNLTLKIRWERDIPVGAVWVDIYKKSGEHISNFVSSRDSTEDLTDKNNASVEVALNLIPGSYYIDVGLWDADLKERFVAAYPACEFIVTQDWSNAKRRFSGLTGLDSSWG